ncbi:unnamed protein product, partial [Laminaria digitata]
RNTLHVEQKELRVVLAHLRAISFDTVEAVSKWRATFVTPEKEGYRQLRSSGSCPPRQSPIDRGSLLHNFTQADLTCEESVGNEEDDNHNRTINQTAFLGVLQSPTSEEKVAGDTAAEVGTDANSYALYGDKETHLEHHLHGDNNARPIFRWKGHNYLVKMAHDLEFLDDTSASAPVTAWLGFSVRGNPFMMPPDGFDVCTVLRRKHEERHEEITVRRRLQRRRDSNRRRNSRSRTNSNSISNSNSNNSSACGAGNDPSPPPSCRQSTPEQQPGRVDNDPDDGPEPPSRASSQPTHSNDSEESIKPRATGDEKTPSPTLVGHDDGGIGAFWMSEVGAGSASTPMDPQLPEAGSFEGEGIPCSGIPCELSSGEEEEARWGGEGHLDFPLIPPLPESIRCKGVTAEVVLREECASEEMLEARAREILADAKQKTGDVILHGQSAKSASRMESLALRSSTEGLKGSLKERHVGISRLTSATDFFSGWEEGQCRQVFTAPPSGAGGGHRRRTRATTASESSLAGMSPFGGRGGIRVTAEGRVADGAGEDPRGGGRNLGWGTTRSSPPCTVPLGQFHSTRSSPPCTLPFGQFRSPGSSRGAGRASSLSHLDVPGSSVEGRTTSAGAFFPAEWSTGVSSSLQASSSSMSARARARAVTERPTATRRPCRNGGKTVIIADPARSTETSRLAACLIQAAFLGVRDRLFVRRLREKRLLASALIRRMWRRWRVRAAKWEVARWQRVERLRRTVEDRKRDRAAHSITIFFRDISYQKQRVRVIPA